jgi:hypothetical protein
MKYIKFLFIVAFIASYSSVSQALTVSPDVCTANPTYCLTDPDHTSHDVTVFPVQLTGLDLLYKYETDNGEDGSALLSGSYSTVDILTDTTTGESDDYVGATVRYDDNGGDIVDCNFPCYLAITDGNHDPGRYLFNLALSGPIGWNGIEDLVLANFWVGQGSISNFAIYGTASPIPVPAAVWLFGTALIGFIGFSRRTSV